MTDKALPFGTYATTPREDAVRRFTAGLSKSKFNRKVASFLLGFAGGRDHTPRDVIIFDDVRVRLHPYDNICEKRVYMTPQFWDADERQGLADFLAKRPTAEVYFVDVGANAGLYTLFSRQAARRAGKTFRSLCVEPMPTMCDRIRQNLSLNGADNDVTLIQAAATSTEGVLHFAEDEGSRGLSHVDETGGLTVEGRKLADMVAEVGFPRIDALKIDVEGHEYDALSAFFEQADGALFPEFILCELTHQDTDHPLRDLFTKSGYELSFSTPLNGIYRRT